MDDAVVHDLKEEILYLRSLLDANGIKYDFEAYCLERRADIQLSTLVKVFRGLGREVSVRVL